MEDMKQFRQFGSVTPGHPENFETPGVEVTTGIWLSSLAILHSLACHTKLGLFL